MGKACKIALGCFVSVVTLTAVVATIYVVVSGQIHGRFADRAGKNQGAYTMYGDARYTDGISDGNGGMKPAGFDDVDTALRYSITVPEPKLVEVPEIECNANYFNFVEYPGLTDSSGHYTRPCKSVVYLDDRAYFLGGVGFYYSPEEDITKSVSGVLRDAASVTDSATESYLCLLGTMVSTPLVVGDDIYYLNYHSIMKLNKESCSFEEVVEIPVEKFEGFCRVSAEDSKIYIVCGHETDSSRFESPAYTDFDAWVYDVSTGELSDKISFDSQGMGVDFWNGFIVEDGKLLFNIVIPDPNGPLLYSGTSTIASCDLAGNWSDCPEFGFKPFWEYDNRRSIGMSYDGIQLMNTPEGIYCLNGDGLYYRPHGATDTEKLLSSEQVGIFRIDGDWLYFVPIEFLHYLDNMTIIPESYNQVQRLNRITGDIQSIDLSPYYSEFVEDRRACGNVGYISNYDNENNVFRSHYKIDYAFVSNVANNCCYLYSSSSTSAGDNRRNLWIFSIDDFGKVTLTKHTEE